MFGSLVFIGMGFSRCDNGLSLAFPFPYSHGVMELFHLVELDCQMVSKLSEVVLGKFAKAYKSLDWYMVGYIVNPEGGDE